ncbi:MAG: N-6 DNA methylase [Endozoicomonadaceae bacterium]|nr:N-6 DNA methylase [Endozoicomonadaceae bacterium]
MAEGKKGGQFYTPKSIVSLIVQILEPFKGRVYNPAMGSGGFLCSLSISLMHTMHREVRVSREAGRAGSTLQSLKTTASLFPNALVDSELGEIPEGWEAGNFSRIALLDTTSVKPNKEQEKVWEHFSIPAFDVDESPRFEFGEEIKSNKYKVNVNSILSSKLNPSTQRTCWPDIEDENSAICSTEFMQFVPRNSGNRTYIIGQILSKPFQKGILQPTDPSSRLVRRVWHGKGEW